MNSKDLSDLVVDALEELKAKDIVKLDVRDLTTVTVKKLEPSDLPAHRSEDPHPDTIGCREYASSITWRSCGL